MGVFNYGIQLPRRDFYQQVVFNSKGMQIPRRDFGNFPEGTFINRSCSIGKICSVVVFRAFSGCIQIFSGCIQCLGNFPKELLLTDKSNSVYMFRSKLDMLLMKGSMFKWVYSVL